MKGKCKECYTVGLRCLKGKCVSLKKYMDAENKKVDFFVKNKEKIRIEKEIAKNMKEQEDFNIRHPEKPQKKKTDKIMPPPTFPDSPAGKGRGKLVVEPCGDGIWGAGVCCCPNRESAERVPNELRPWGYGKLPSPDTLWDKCRNYGCWPPPHHYE